MIFCSNFSLVITIISLICWSHNLIKFKLRYISIQQIFCNCINSIDFNCVFWIISIQRLTSQNPGKFILYDVKNIVLTAVNDRKSVIVSLHDFIVSPRLKLWESHLELSLVQWWIFESCFTFWIRSWLVWTVFKICFFVVKLLRV